MTLYLLPNLLHPDADPALNFVRGLDAIVDSLDGFFVENPKEARVYLKHFAFDKLRTKPMEVVNKDTKDFASVLVPLLQKERWGMISDAGLPCIADPGAKLVWEAKERGISVVAIPGPSSVFLALMLSGLESQSFIFHGYMPRDGNIQKMNALQVFIETPYNNSKTLERLLGVLCPEDKLCIAANLTLPNQQVITKSVLWWREHYRGYDFHKKPAIFLIKTA